MGDPLDGCRAKIARASELCEILSTEIGGYLQGESPPYEIIREHRADGLEYTFVAKGHAGPPLKFAVVAGEIIHHLRSSLDHLIHSLVVSKGKSPTKNHQFPICDTPQSFKELLRRGYIQSIGPNASQIVESVQPFQSPTPDDTILAVVRDLNNEDKHRLLVVTTTVMRIGNVIRVGADEALVQARGTKDQPINIVGLGGADAKQLHPEGVEIFTIRLSEPTPEFYAEADVEPNIAFEKCGRSTLVPLVPTLRRMTAGVTNVINKFSSEISENAL